MVQEVRSIHNCDSTIGSRTIDLAPDLLASPFSREELPASNSVRASMRRMRVETPSYTHQIDEKDVEIFYQDLEQALKEEKYAEGLQLIQKFETQWNGELFESYVRGIEKEIPIVTRDMLKELGDAAIQLSKSFFLAMEKDRDALAAVDEGMVHLRSGVESVIEMLKSMGAPSEVLVPIRQELDAFNSVYKGLLAFSLGDKAEALAHFRQHYSQLSERTDLETEEVFDQLLLLRIMEKYLGEEILPVPTTVDVNDPEALLLAGRFEEALAIIEPMNSSDIYLPSLPLIYLLKGDLTMAKKEALSNSVVELAVILLLLRGIEEN